MNHYERGRLAGFHMKIGYTEATSPASPAAGAATAVPELHICDIFMHTREVKLFLSITTHLDF